jgi:hypothetical protein
MHESHVERQTAPSASAAGEVQGVCKVHALLLPIERVTDLI